MNEKLLLEGDLVNITRSVNGTIEAKQLLGYKRDVGDEVKIYSIDAAEVTEKQLSDMGFGETILVNRSGVRSTVYKMSVLSNEVYYVATIEHIGGRFVLTVEETVGRVTVLKATVKYIHQIQNLIATITDSTDVL